MAEPFGIIGVIGVAAQIIQASIHFGLDWKDAPADAKSFINELQILKTVLSETNMNILLNPDFDNAFHGRQSALLKELGPLAHGTPTIAMTSACQTELQRLLDELKRRAQGHPIGWGRLKGAFQSTRTREAVGDLHRQCMALNLLLTIDAVALVASLHRQVEEVAKKQQQMYRSQYRALDHIRDRIDSREASDQRGMILNWLTPIDYASQHNDFIGRRQKGTGREFLDSTEFNTWLETGGQTLFCPGIPGAGKTILTSIVVDDLTNRFGDEESIGIAYIYCNFRQHDTQQAEDLLASLLKQLARSSRFIELKSLYNKHEVKKTRPPLDEISKTLQSVAATYSRVFIIVDALDECQASNRCRSRFLSEILALQAMCAANIFATSRNIPDITEKFDGSLTREIRASEKDVENYVDAHLSNLPSFLAHRTKLQIEVKTKITQAVDGMFLLAQLYLNSLIGKRSPNAVRTVLERLPKGSEAYDYAYNSAMERIEKQAFDQEELAKQILSWITCAKRPLTTSELRHALGVKAGSPALDEDDLPQLEDMVSVCAGLVTVDYESGIIRLVHQTTQEYFQRTQSRWFPNAEYEITATCITYLSFDVFESGVCQTDHELDQRLQKNQLYDYAAHNWGHHANQSLTECELVDFLKCEKRVGAAVQALLTSEWAECEGYSQIIPEKVTGLHLAAFLGVVSAVRLLVGIDNLNARDSWDQTPLSWAAKGGHEAVVIQLLAKGAKVDMKDDRGRTPLSWAAGNGHEAVVIQLLANGAEVDAEDYRSRTPLSYAASRGHEAVVMQLLAKGAIDTGDI